MRIMRRPVSRRYRGGGLALGALALGSAGLAAGATHATSARAATTPAWVTTTGKTVHLTLIAGWNNANAGFNFDGGAHGQLVITVPLGDKVVATFKNNAQGAMHDAVVIPYTLPLPSSATSPVFAGAASPLPTFGAGGPPSSAGAAQTFTFTASKAGTYMVVCGIAGHALAGMWDRFVVSSHATSAAVTTTTATSGSATGATAPRAKTQTWATTHGTTVRLSLISGWDNDNAGFNFNGASNGHMVVTVPLGDKVVATYKNAATTPHDVRIITYQKPLPAHTVALAFPGASAGGGGFGRPGAGGPPKGAPGAGGPPSSSHAPQTFTFVANKAGTYMIMCGFPGHALAGMWDTFVVSKTTKIATVTFH